MKFVLADLRGKLKTLPEGILFLLVFTNFYGKKNKNIKDNPFDLRGLAALRRRMLSGNSQTGSLAGGCLCHSPCNGTPPPPTPLPLHPPSLTPAALGELGSRWRRPRASERASARGGAMCHAVLCCRALSNPQEDCAPPRPPLPESYEPDPPAIPPLPSRAGLRPSSLHRPEDRKTNHRNGSSSVSSLTPDLWAAPPPPTPTLDLCCVITRRRLLCRFSLWIFVKVSCFLWITFWFASSHFVHHQLLLWVFFELDETLSAKYQCFFGSSSLLLPCYLC